MGELAVLQGDHSRTGCAIEARLRWLRKRNPTGVEVGKAASYLRSKEVRGQEHDVRSSVDVRRWDRLKGETLMVAERS
jgi:hypothetical protein